MLAAMRVHLYHQYFRHPDEGGALRSFFVGKALQEAGHEVLIITAHNEQRGLVDIDGLQVHYLPIKYSNEFPFGRRIRAFVQFVRQATRTSRKYPRADINYIITTPLTTGLIGLYLKRFRGTPYAFEVGDLWPEVPVQMQMITNKYLQKALYGLERRIYKNAEKLIGLSPPIRDYMEYTCDFNVKAVSIPNMADCDFFQPTPTPSEFTPESPMVISYIGTFGRANHLDYLLALAKTCEEQELPVHFQLMGEGAKLPLLEKQAEQLSNVSILEFGNREEVKALLDQSQAVYVSFLDVPILSTGSPNKFFDGLAAGKLILLNFGGWMKKLIDEHECGVHCAPDDPEAAAANLRPFLSSTLLLEEYQSNARKLAEEQFSRTQLCQQVVDYLASH